MVPELGNNSRTFVPPTNRLISCGLYMYTYRTKCIIQEDEIYECKVYMGVGVLFMFTLDRTNFGKAAWVPYTQQGVPLDKRGTCDMLYLYFIYNKLMQSRVGAAGPRELTFTRRIFCI